MSLAATTHQIRYMRTVGMADRRKRMPRQRPMMPLIRDYAARLVFVVDTIHAALGPVMSELPVLVRNTRVDVRLDAGESKRFQELMKRVRDAVGMSMRQEQLEKVTARIFEQTSIQNKVELSKQIKAALGVNVLINDPKLNDQAQDFIASNVSAIKSIPEKLLGQVEQVVYTGIKTGKTSKDLADEIEETFDVSKKKAAMIARNEIGTLYGQLNAERQQSIGITRFIWRTVRDQRVRDEHTEREIASDPKLGGTPYLYEDPPDGELPGEPINCRCHAEPVFSDILEAA